MLLPFVTRVLAIVFHLLGYHALGTHVDQAEDIPIGIALGVVAVVLLGSVAASLIWPRKPRSS